MEMQRQKENASRLKHPFQKECVCYTQRCLAAFFKMRQHSKKKNKLFNKCKIQQVRHVYRSKRLVIVIIAAVHVLFACIALNVLYLIYF